MIRSPLHLLISLQRFLYRTKVRHKAAFIFSRPITKSTSWSATIALRIPRASTQISAKSIPSSVQQESSHQLLRMTQRQSPITRRLLISRQSPRQSHAAVYVQYRTMLSSGNSSNHQITTVLNPAQFFTPRPPILGVHGGVLPPPTPQSSLRSYVNHPPWANQQHQQMGPASPLSPSSAKVDMDDIDNSHEGEYFNNNRYRQHSNQRLLTNTTSIAATQNTVSRQQSYQPPNMRGMADLMEVDNGKDKVITQVDTDGMGNNRYSPGLVHRGQPPKKWSPRQKQSVTSTASTRRVSAMNVLRHDDLSLQTTNKRRSSTSISSAIETTSSSTAAPDDDDKGTFLDLTHQWYISIPMDLTFLMQPDNPSSSPTFSASTTLASATGNLFGMENAASILDPIWLKSFDQWGKLIRNHLTKVMVLIRLVGLEAQQYYAKGRQRNTANKDTMEMGGHGDHRRYSDSHTNNASALANPTTETATATSRMDFKMMMMRKANTPSELRIYLPRHLCTPLPTTVQNIQQWVHRLMKDPPCFEIKRGTKEPSTADKGDDEATHFDNDLATAMMDNHLFEIPTDGTHNDEQGMEVDGLSENDNGDDDAPWRIGPLYFQGIHSFLNHVDTMIDSSPAFATGGQRRSSL